jgi:hypothetical protein
MSGDPSHSDRPLRSAQSPSKRDKKILRDIIDKGLQKEFAAGIEQLEMIIHVWRQRKIDTNDVYRKLNETMHEHDKTIARRYDQMGSANYAQIVAAQLADGLISETDLEELSDEMRQQIIQWSHVWRNAG